MNKRIVAKLSEMKYEEIRWLLYSQVMLVIDYTKLEFKKPEDVPHIYDNYEVIGIYAPYRTDPIFNNHIVVCLAK